MSNSGTSSAAADMHKFARDHRTATSLLYVATADYAAARCLALNLLMPCLVMGAQAAEKFLKAFLLLHEPQRDVRKLSHSLAKLLDEVVKLTPALGLAAFRPLTDKFDGHYRTRYPDNLNASKSMTTADIRELDEFIILLNENLPCPFNVKYRTGLYAAITFSLGYNATVTPTEHWIKLNNTALAPLLPRIAADYKKVMKAINSPP